MLKKVQYTLISMVIIGMYSVAVNNVGDVSVSSVINFEVNTYK